LILKFPIQIIHGKDGRVTRTTEMGEEILFMNQNIKRLVHVKSVKS
jgi:hypothetical protein